MAMDGNSELDVLKEHAVYPGHPITVALCIVRAFSSNEEAATPHERTGFSMASSSGSIPGAGGNVHSAMHLLQRMKEGLLGDESKVFEWADESWARCDSQKNGGYAPKDRPHDPTYYTKRWAEGQEQADRFKATFMKEVAEWLR